MSLYGIGHNGGPALEGARWRRHCWSKARADLLPQLPLNVIKRRVARAKELRLDYRTYATVRASTGCDIIGFLFSDNALRLHRQQAMPPARVAKLESLCGVKRLAAVHGPLAGLPEGLPLERVIAAPGLTDSVAAERQILRAGLRADRLPGDAVLVIGATALERGWSVSAGLAGYIDEARFFG